MMRNQKGYAFLLVLGTIVIIGLLVPPLAFQVLSSSTQASQTEQNIQLDNMYDMGKQMGRRHVEAALVGDLDYDEFEGGDWADAVSHFENQLKNSEPLRIENLHFDTYTGSVEIDFKDVEDEDGRLFITYYIFPSINDEIHEPEIETFILRGVEGQGNGSQGSWYDDEGNIIDNIFEDDPVNSFEGNGNLVSGSVNQEIELVNAIFRSGHLTLTNDNDINGPLAFDRGVEIRTPSNDGRITIHGDVFSSGAMFDLFRNSTIVINGDAHFRNTHFKFRHQNNASDSFIFIDGDIYNYDDSVHQHVFENTQDDKFIKVESLSDVEPLTEKRNVYYTGSLISGISGEEDGGVDLIEGLQIEGTRASN